MLWKDADPACRDDVLPCRAYLRHCILASQNLGEEAHTSFMDNTFLVLLFMLPKQQAAWLLVIQAQSKLHFTKL